MASRRRKQAPRGAGAIAAGVAGAAAVVLAASVAGLLAALAPAAPPVAEAAVTAPAPAAAPWTRSTPVPGAAAPAVPAPAVDPRAGTRSAGPGMAVPQPPRPVRTGLVITPFVGVGRSPELETRPASCGGFTAPRQMAPGVAPGPGGSATVSWQAGGRAEVVGYRVSAVSQALRPGVQPAPLQQTVAQPAGCGPVTLAFAGLTPGEVYVFWLEERTVDAATDVTRFVQVGTSAPVVIGR